MGNLSRSEKIAIIVLALILLSIVSVSLVVTWSNHHIDQQLHTNIAMSTESQITQTSLNSEEFRYWQDKITQWIVAIFSIVSAALSLLAIIYVRNTLNEARKTTNAAIATLHADRAWMTQSGMEMQQGMLLSLTVPQPGRTFAARWENTGRSPALKAKAGIAIRILPANEEMPVFDIDKDLMAASDVLSPIGPGKIIFTGLWPVTQADIERMKAGHVRIWIYSKILYCDIYSPTITRSSESMSEVKLDFENMPGPDGQLYTTFGFEPKGSQNTAS